MTQQTYEASVYSKVVNYTNFNSTEKKTTLYFALDPIQLLELIAAVPSTKSKSRNPAKQGQEEEISEEQMVKLVRKLAAKAAGFPSEDGESWEPFEDFENTIAGKAFMTQMVSSDKQRKEFAEKVFLDPFRAYVRFAAQDPSNTPKEIQQMEGMLAQLEKTFAESPDPEESLDERRDRLRRELDGLGDAPSDDA